jgi:hypothetical protein
MASPPSHKLSVLSHLGYIFAAGDVTYSEGHIEPVYNSAVVKGVGTNLRGTFAKRVLYVEGAGKPYEIASVDEANQTMTLTAPFSDVVPKFPRYAIRSAPGERRLVYYCEPGRWEAWPEWSALALPEDGDDIVGQMVKGLVRVRAGEPEHLEDHDPGGPGQGRVQLQPDRARLRQQSLSRPGRRPRLHAGRIRHSQVRRRQERPPISTPIQPIFQQGIAGTSVQVNWSADKRLWHAAHDPVREVIRWFVAMSGHRQPRHAICYEYRLDRWWIEEYPYPITSSAVGLLGYRRSMAGSVARRVLVLAEGTTDAVSEGNAFRGTVTSSGPLSLTDSSASFPAGLAGAPVAIAEGAGVGQWRRIVANDTTTIQIDRPWTVRPSAESLYQVGGVSLAVEVGMVPLLRRRGRQPSGRGGRLSAALRRLDGPGTLLQSLRQAPRVGLCEIGRRRDVHAGPAADRGLDGHRRRLRDPPGRGPPRGLRAGGPLRRGQALGRPGRRSGPGLPGHAQRG